MIRKPSQPLDPTCGCGVEYQARAFPRPCHWFAGLEADIDGRWPAVRDFGPRVNAALTASRNHSTGGLRCANLTLPPVSAANLSRCASLFLI
jgi:hypothetical protein